MLAGTDDFQGQLYYPHTLHFHKYLHISWKGLKTLKDSRLEQLMGSLIGQLSIFITSYYITDSIAIELKI